MDREKLFYQVVGLSDKLRQAAGIIQNDVEVTSNDLDRFSDDVMKVVKDVQK